MEDLQIIELYFERNENAIKETDAKYGKLCFRVANNILKNNEDSEECVSDTYLSTWNQIPPTRPNNFMAFLCKITRNLSLKRMTFLTAAKRTSVATVSFDEIEGIETGASSSKAKSWFVQVVLKDGSSYALFGDLYSEDAQKLEIFLTERIFL